MMMTRRKWMPFHASEHRRWLVFKFLLAGAAAFICFMSSLEFPFLQNKSFLVSAQRRAENEAYSLAGNNGGRLLHYDFMALRNKDGEMKGAPLKPTITVSAAPSSQDSQMRTLRIVSNLVFSYAEDTSSSSSSAPGSLSELEKSAIKAWKEGRETWVQLQSAVRETKKNNSFSSTVQLCPQSITLTGMEFIERARTMVLPCGLMLGSHITIVGKPNTAQLERDSRTELLKEGADSVHVSQFTVELQGLKTVDGEEPPKILLFNSRLRRDWSEKPVIEQNTCYRTHCGTPLRCNGLPSRVGEETIDGLVKCEKWIVGGDINTEESDTTWKLNRLVGRQKDVSFDWPFPFVQDKLFVLTVTAGLEGYHASVDGRHVTSFPYRTAFLLEDVTRLSVNGDVEVHSVIAASLRNFHGIFSPQRFLQFSDRWKAPPLPDGPVELFIGILSAGNHFIERMAVRQSWMQSELIKSSRNGRKEVNVKLKKEAEFYNDIVIVPFMDSYDLVVLKTVSICEYGVRSVSARYIMKCDDDTFIRLNAVIHVIKKVPENRTLYAGNINYHHKPLRHGKWAVTYEEWPEEAYPPYANGPGYVISSDIAEFVVSEFEQQKLRLFKMEDVSLGMWIEKFNASMPVKYLHDWKFCQFGCVDNYITAHYQSPRQMMCMWDKLRRGKAWCCNMR